MNFSNPILIYSNNEQFRFHIRDILMKNGFFHILESASETETKNYIGYKKDYIVLIDSNILDSSLHEVLKTQKNYIVFSNKNEDITAKLAAQIGTEKILCYPIHSRKLLEKINNLP